MNSFFAKIIFLFSFMGTKRKLYYLAGITIAIATIFNYLGPLMVQFSIDVVLKGDNNSAGSLAFIIKAFPALPSFLKSHLWICGLVFIILAIFQGIFTFLTTFLTSKAAEGMTKNIRDALYNHLNHLPFLRYSQLATGDLIQRCSSDVETVKLFIQNQLFEVCRLLIMLILVVPLMISISIKMTILSLFIVPFIVTFSFIFFVKIRVLFKDCAEAEASLSTITQENLSGIRLVRAFSRKDHEIMKFGHGNEHFRQAYLRLIKILSLYWSTSAFFCRLQAGAVLLVGTYWVIHDSLTIGELTVFLLYITILIWPIRMLGRIMAEMGKALVSLERLQKIFSEPLEVNHAAYSNYSNSFLKPTVNKDICFNNCSFTYPNSDKPALHNLNFSITAGSTIAIIGPTGSGKSTLLHLLPRLLDYQTGSITIGGIELNQIDRDWMRKNIGIVLQEPFLFSRTVYENIQLGAIELNQEEVLRVAKIACIHDTITNTFAKHYETIVGERGVTLSGGQKQRIAIARALIKDAPILIFDDSLSAVDAETDRNIQQKLNNRCGKSTTIIVSHRISTVSQADLILVMEDGTISQQGKHEELLAKPGLYRDIFNIQELLADELRQEERAKD